MHSARALSVFLAAALVAAPAAAQRPDRGDRPQRVESDSGKANTSSTPQEDSSATEHSITIAGKPVP